MLIDSVLFMNPEEVDDRFMVATYYCATKPSQNVMKFAAALAVEQTTGTWLPVPEETPELRKKFIGRIVGIYETPAYQMEIPEDVTERHFTIQIAYPWRNFGPMFSMMLTTVIGNISSSGKVKLVDINFPKEYLADFKGPKFGIRGIRDYLGVYNRPLVSNMIKPCTGIDPKTTAKLAYEAAVGGIDIIKDDELVADAKHCPLVDRVKAVMEALKRADDEKGEKTIFVFNITDRTEKLLDNAHRAIDAGANGLMLNYFPIGLDAARMVCEDPNVNVPVLGHADFTGAVYESPWSGLSAKLIRGKLVRLAGLDVLLLSSPYGKFPNLMDTIFNMALTITSPLKHIKPTFPAISGGTMQGHVEEIINQFGDDVVIAAGGAIHGHPMGAKAGAKAFRQAIDAVKSGIGLEEAGRRHQELGMALDAWGIYKPAKKGGLFDIKG